MDTPLESMDKPIEKKKGLKKKHIIWFVAGAAFIALIYLAIFTDRTSTYRIDQADYQHGRRRIV